MTMKKSEKEKIITHVHKYVNARQPLTLIQYTRLMRWLEGMTFKTIASDDKVSEQAVAYSVKRDCSRIKKFAEINDKYYNV